MGLSFHTRKKEREEHSRFPSKSDFSPFSHYQGIGSISTPPKKKFWVAQRCHGGARHRGTVPKIRALDKSIALITLETY